ncbi:MAG: DUF554 domain-containing protein [Succinivibrio sp.]|nr:DUF554 domain-containing protein [Succinivibrio sp.]
MFAVIVNTLAIMLGAGIGLLLRRGISAALSEQMLKALGLCTMVIGIQGALVTSNILILIIAIASGVLIGEIFDLDGKVNRFTAALLEKHTKGPGQAAQMAEAFISSCLIMNVGAMVIVGSLDAGLRANYTMLYTKSLLDFISGIMLAATMGVGVMGSALFTLIFQGAIVLGAEVIAPLLSDRLIGELSATGCVIILAIGLNMVGLTRFKLINYLPALLIVPLILLVMH